MINIRQERISDYDEVSDFYHKAGFKATYKYSIYHVNDKERSAEWSMVLELFDGALNNISGTIRTE